MELFDKMTLKAKENVQRIVLPEGTEPRTLKAADRIIGDGLAKILLICDPAGFL
ncbi:MAG: phosphate acetyltransferase, partial [Muribaculaceae bacterium]|nr:phosphate acetyltransferase [Muribaculaceae bacterium]